MGYVVSQLQAILSLEDQGFTSGMKKAQQETKKTKQEVESASSSFEKVGNSLGRVGSALSLAVTVPLVALGRQAIKTATDFDSLKRGMIAVEGSAEKAEKSIKRLEQTAKLPGLGFKEVQQGYINLRAAGQQADLAVRSLEAFGNALTTVGKGKSELDGVILALSQIEAKGKVSAEEINQLAERVPQIRQIMISAFGTADTEVIQRAKITSSQFVETIVTELEKLPKATGGIKNDFENAMDSIDKSLNRLGTSLAPKAASALNSLADVADRLSTSWDKLPKERQDLYTNLGLTALAAGPALTLLSNISQLAVNLGQLGLSLQTVGKFGVAALPVLAAVMAFKPHWIAAGETADAEKNAKDGNKYVAGSKLGQSIVKKSDAGTLQQYLGYLKKGQGAYEFLRANRGPGFNDVSNLLDRELGTDRRSDTAAKVAAAIAKLQAEARRAQTDYDAGKGHALRASVNSLFDPLKIQNLIKNPIQLNAAEMAAKRKAEEDAKKEAERLRKQREREAQQHRENVAKNNQEMDRQIYINGATDEYERRRRQAELDRRDNSKGGSAAKAKRIYDDEIAKINREQKREAAKPFAKALSDVPDFASGAGSDGLLAMAKAIVARQKQKEALEMGLLRMPDIASRTGHGPGASAWPGTLREDGTVMSEAEAREALRKAAAASVISTMPAWMRSDTPTYDYQGKGRWNTSPGGLGPGMSQNDLDLKAARDRVKRVRWHQKAVIAGSDSADSLGVSSRMAAMELMNGASPGQAARTLSKNLIEAMQQGAGREIERVVARSLTNPIAKAIEQGFDPVTGKLKGAISEALNSVTGTAAALISSAYALYGVMGRKKKFGIGSLVGAAAGFFSGGPAGAMAGYNIGNALDNGDLAGAVTGYLVTSGSQELTGKPFPKPGGGRPDGADNRSIHITNVGWTVNSQADENRLLTNMTRRVRVASVTRG